MVHSLFLASSISIGPDKAFSMGTAPSGSFFWAERMATMLACQPVNFSMAVKPVLLS